MRISIQRGRLVDPGNRIDAPRDLFIADGKIVALDQAPDGFHADRTIDGSNLIVCPGLIDLSARLREPGFEYKATLESEMLAAVAGGVTSLACPPDTDPPLDEPGLVEMLKHRARNLNQAHVYPLGALTQGLRGERLTEMAELCDAGCVAFSQADVPLRDAAVLLRAMQYAATFGFSVWLRPQNGSLARGGVAHDGELATRLGLAPIPVCAETVALATMLLLARETGAKLHLCRLSSAAGVAMIRAAKSEGLAITCDIAVNHAHLCENDIGFFDSNCHLSPPLRSAEDRDALRAALRDGTIDAICSDHTPVDDDAKQLPFAEAEIGATGLELLLPLTLRWAQESDVALVEALAKITSEPARIIGQADGLSGQPAGQLGVGAAADICIFHPERRWKVEAKSLKSQGKNTPFIGQEMLGKVRYTLVNGDVVREPT